MALAAPLTAGLALAWWQLSTPAFAGGAAASVGALHNFLVHLPLGWLALLAVLAWASPEALPGWTLLAAQGALLLAFASGLAGLGRQPVPLVHAAPALLAWAGIGLIWWAWPGLRSRSRAWSLTACCLVALAAGRQGGRLAHGLELEPSRLPSGPGVSVGEVVGAVLNQRCASCHGGSDPESDLHLDSLEALRLLPPEIVRAGRPADSELVWRLYLGRGDSRRMPPEGEAPLSPSEAELLRRWVEDGARLEGPVPVGLARLVSSVSGPRSPERAGSAARSPEEARRRAREAGWSVTWDRGGLVSIAWFGGGQPAFEPLVELGSGVGRLELRAVSLTSLQPLAALGSLRSLDLAGAELPPGGVAALPPLPSLEVLGLWGQPLDLEAVSALRRQPSLRRVYVGGAAVSDVARAALADQGWLASGSP